MSEFHSFLPIVPKFPVPTQNPVSTLRPPISKSLSLPFLPTKASGTIYQSLNQYIEPIKMTKGGKLQTKLKSVLKKWNSFSKQSRPIASVGDDASSIISGDHLHPVYVGKSRRRYLVSSDVVDHPLFRELVDRSSSTRGDSEDSTINVACEVVLFEHLLWMLVNADPQPESLDELVEFYAC